MATSMYFGKGKGPFRNGSSHAGRYANLEREINDLVQRGNPRALKEQANIADIMSSLRTGAPSGARIGDGFALGKRDIVPDTTSGTSLLTSMSVQYASPDLIGMELLPFAPVDEMSGTYPIVNRSDRLQAVRGRGTGRRGQSNEIPITESEGTYTTAAHDHKGVIGLDSVLSGNLAARRAPINRLTRTVDDVGYHHGLDHEVEAAVLLTDPATYSAGNTTALTAGIHWDNADGTININVDDAKLKLKNGKGTTELIGWTTTPIWNAIKRNSGLLNVMSANDRGYITEEMFVELMGLDGLLVSDLVLNEANIGVTPDLQYAWGNNFGILRVSRTPSLLNAAFGYSFRWSMPNLPADSMMVGKEGMLTRLWFEPDVGPMGSYIYKVASYWGINTVDVDLGYLYTDVLETFPAGA